MKKYEIFNNIINYNKSYGIKFLQILMSNSKKYIFVTENARVITSNYALNPIICKGENGKFECTNLEFNSKDSRGFTQWDKKINDIMHEYNTVEMYKIIDCILDKAKQKNMQLYKIIQSSKIENMNDGFGPFIKIKNLYTMNSDNTLTILNPMFLNIENIIAIEEIDKNIAGLINIPVWDKLLNDYEQEENSNSWNN